jgi:hypothetical protein
MTKIKSMEITTRNYARGALRAFLAVCRRGNRVCPSIGQV